MSDQYHFWGLIMSVLFLFTAYALFDQLRVIYKRKQDGLKAGQASDVVSLNRTFASFSAFFANFLLGISYEKFDLYLVGTRTVAIAFLFATFYQIYTDRKNKSSLIVLLIAIIAFALSVLLAYFNREFLISNLAFAKGYSVFATVFLWQGYIHQIYLLRKFKKIGGLSVLYYQLYLIKETSMVAFAFTLGLSNGWPLILMHGSMLSFILILLWNFRKIRISS